MAMKVTMLGTGHATVTKCYNTCFALSDGEEHFLVDAGGGNQILRILEEEGIPLGSIHHMFVSHGHTDHVMGAIWVIRMIGQLIRDDRYDGIFHVYCHEELCADIREICKRTLGKKVLNSFDDRIRFEVLEDGQSRKILGCEMQFFDIYSTKKKQFAFSMILKNGERLAFCGDEPVKEQNIQKIQGSAWLMHEAFCLYAERDIFQPYKKSHSTVKDACETAERLQIKNLILYHTEDKNIQKRKELYLAEGKQYYSGNLFVPDDREIILLDGKTL